MSVIGSDESMDEFMEFDTHATTTGEGGSWVTKAEEKTDPEAAPLSAERDEHACIQEKRQGNDSSAELAGAAGDTETDELEAKSAGVQDIANSSACVEDNASSFTSPSEKGDCKAIPEGTNIPSTYLTRARRFEALISGVYRAIRKKAWYVFREDLMGPRTKMLLEGDFIDSNWISLLSQAVYEESKRANKRITKRLARNKKLKFK